jgi:thiamine transporter
MHNRRIGTIVEIALCVALAAVLNAPGLRIQLPMNIAGGTVSLAMLPVFVLALRRGLAAGVVGGAVYGVIDVLVDPFVVHPIQFLLDYPVAYGLAGLAGAGSGAWHTLARSGRLRRGGAVAAASVALGGAGRFGAHWISGLVFFGANAPKGQPVWLYSLAYNASYLVPSLVVCGVAALAVLPVLERALPVSGGGQGVR